MVQKRQPTAKILEELFDRNQHKLVPNLKFFSLKQLQNYFVVDCIRCWKVIWERIKEKAKDKLDEI